MASVIKCDRCGHVSDKLIDFKHIRVYKLTSATTFNTNDKAHFDICEICYENMFDFNEKIGD